MNRIRSILTIAAAFLITMYTVVLSQSPQVAATVIDAVESDKANPVHIAVLMDCSGSVADNSETLRNSRSNAASFIGKIFVTLPDTAVSVYGYSNDVKQECNLLPVLDLNNLDTVREAVNSMPAQSGTNTSMVEAIHQACNDLRRESVPGVQDAIVVFTDGEETVSLTREAAEANEDAISLTVANALTDDGQMPYSDIRVYCIGYDYINSRGVHSLRNPDTNEIGYGEKLLTEFATRSGGKYYSADADNLERAFDQIVMDITHSKIEDAKSIEQRHDIPLEIPAGAVEANIRISCSTPEAVRNGKIILRDADGNLRSLMEYVGNTDVWYATDALGANIKLLYPHEGTWILNVSDIITEQDVFLSFNIIYNVGMQTEISYTGSDSGKEVSVNDEVKVQTKLFVNDKLVDSPQLYQDTDMIALYFGRYSDFPQGLDNMSQSHRLETLNNLAEQHKLTRYNLSVADTSFTATLKETSEIGVYCIAILLDDQYYDCYESYVITIGDTISLLHPFETIRLINGREAVISDLMSYVNSSGASISLKQNSDGQIADVTLDGDVLRISGKSPGKTTVMLEYMPQSGIEPLNTEIDIEILNSDPQFKGEFPIFVETEANGSYRIENLSSYIDDLENDIITFSVSEVSDSSMIDVRVENNALVIDGLKASKKGQGATFVLYASDGGLNPAKRTVTVSVARSSKERWMIAALVCGGIILLLLFVRLIWIATRKVELSLWYITLHDQKTGDTWCMTPEIGDNLPRGNLNLIYEGKSGDFTREMPNGLRTDFSDVCSLANEIHVIGSHAKKGMITLKSKGHPSKRIKFPGCLPGEKITAVLRNDVEAKYIIGFTVGSSEDYRIIQLMFATGWRDNIAPELDGDMEEWYETTVKPVRQSSKRVEKTKMKSENDSGSVPLKKTEESDSEQKSESNNSNWEDDF